MRWCLEHGLRVTQPLTLMTVGLYNAPPESAGAVHPLLSGPAERSRRPRLAAVSRSRKDAYVR